MASNAGAGARPKAAGQGRDGTVIDHAAGAPRSRARPPTGVAWHESLAVTTKGGVAGPDATSPSASPFAYAAFTIIWIASVVSNLGTWMYNAASG